MDPFSAVSNQITVIKSNIDVLSSAYPTLFVDDNRITYPSLEHYAQHFLLNKLGMFREAELLLTIPNAVGCVLTASRVIQDKQRGINPQIFNKVYTDTKHEGLRRAVQYRIDQDELFQHALMATGQALIVVADPFDGVWGIGHDEIGLKERIMHLRLDAPTLYEWMHERMELLNQNGIGQNRYGMVLMEARGMRARAALHPPLGPAEKIKGFLGIRPSAESQRQPLLGGGEPSRGGRAAYSAAGTQQARSREMGLRATGITAAPPRRRVSPAKYAAPAGKPRLTGANSVPTAPKPKQQRVEKDSPDAKRARNELPEHLQSLSLADAQALARQLVVECKDLRDKTLARTEEISALTSERDKLVEARKALPKPRPVKREPRTPEYRQMKEAFMAGAGSVFTGPAVNDPRKSRFSNTGQEKLLTDRWATMNFVGQIESTVQATPSDAKADDGNASMEKLSEMETGAAQEASSFETEYLVKDEVQ